MTRAPQPDPLAAPLEQMASELLGSPLDPTTEEQMGRSQPRPRQREVDLTDGLPEDEAFEARIDRVQYRPPTSSESDVVGECLAWLAVQSQCVAHKVHGSIVSGGGEPDLDIVWRGRAVKIEAKAEGSGAKYRPTAAQERRLQEYQQAGALVGWVCGLDQLRDILDHADDSTYRYDGRPGANAPGAP